MFSLPKFSAQATSARHQGSSATSVCVGVVAIALLASLITDLSGSSFLDEGSEELILLAFLIPLSFAFASYWRRGKNAYLKNSTSSTHKASTQPSFDESYGGSAALPDKLECCAKSGNIQEAKALLSEALESDLDFSRLAVCFGHLFQACAIAKDTRAAKEGFERMKEASVKANVVHYGTLISVHAQIGDLGGAEMFFQECINSDIEPNTVCYNTMLYACSRANNFAKLKEWFAHMEEARVQRDQITFSTSIHAAVRAQDASCLEAWAKQMYSEGFVLQPRSYEDVLAMCVHANFPHVAEMLFQDLIKSKVALTNKIVHHIARSRLYAGNGAACMEVLESAFKNGLELLPNSFVTAAEASNKLGDFPAASLWLSHAEEVLAQCIENFAMIAAVALCACKLDKAIIWMQKLQDCGTAEQISTGYLTTLKCCARLNDDTSACLFADNAMKAGISLTIDGYSAAVKACCRACNLKAAESWLHKMMQAGMTDDQAAFCSVVSLCARLEDVARGEYWLNHMSSLCPQSDACLRAFLDMCEKSHSKAAKHSASRVIGKLDPKNIHFASGDNSLFLLKALLKFGYYEKAKSVLQIFTPKFGKAVSVQGYQTIINMYAQEGNFKAAEEWLTRMTRAGLPADVIAYSTIIHACAKASDPLRAEEVLVQMQEAQVEPNTICFNEVINAYAEAGDLAKAEHYFEAIKQRNLTPSTSTYNSILKACAKSGNVARAEEWFYKMVESGLDGVDLDETTFGTLMNVSKDKDPKKTEHWLQIARSHGVKLNVVHFSTAIHAHAKVGDFQKAEALFEQALADGLEPNSMCYNNVISACAEALQPERAEGWLHKMRQSGVSPNSFTCYTVVNAWLKINDFARVQSVITAMEKDDLYPREEVFTAFAKTVVRSGSWADFEDCIAMTNKRGYQDNEFFLHAHLSGLVRFGARPNEVEIAVRTAVSRGVKLNPYIANLLSRALPYAKAEAIIKECGGIVEASRKPHLKGKNPASSSVPLAVPPPVPWRK